MEDNKPPLNGARSGAQAENFRSGAYYRIKNRGSRVLLLAMNAAHPEHLVRLLPGEAITLEGRQVTANPRLADQITALLSAHQVVVQDLKIEANHQYQVINQTPRRIGIQHFDGSEDLILPPFGSRVISSDLLNGYDYLPWTWQALVSVSPLAKVKRNRAALIWRFLVMLFFILFLMVTLPMAIIRQQALIWNILGGGVLVFIVAFTILHYLIESQSELDNFFNHIEDFVQFFPGIALVLMIGIGLPLIAYNQQVTDQTYLSNLGNLETLGSFMQVMFIAIASILPALLYYLFGRMQVAKQQDSFFREVLVLDPHVESFSEAESKYEPLLDSIYGTGSAPFSILLLVISTALLVMGWMVTLPPSNVTLTTSSTILTFFQVKPDYFVFGFLGAYFFAINMIFRRYVRADLNPKTYAYITVRLLITIVLVWVIQSLPQFTTETRDPLVNSALYAVSFMIGIFPDWGVAMIKDATRNLIKGMHQDDSDDSMPLSDLEGMNLYDRARLLEEGIENIENLVHHNLMEMIARTRIPTSRLVDMFDQSILYLHLGMYDEANDGDKHDQGDYNGRAMLSKLKSFGVRTASGLLELLDPRHPQTYARFKAGFSDEEVNRLELIAEAIKNERWLTCIQNWMQFNQIEAPVTNPYKFYYHDVEPEPVVQAAAQPPVKLYHASKKKHAHVMPAAVPAPPVVLPDLKEPKLSEG